MPAFTIIDCFASFTAACPIFFRNDGVSNGEGHSSITF